MINLLRQGYLGVVWAATLCSGRPTVCFCRLAYQKHTVASKSTLWHTKNLRKHQKAHCGHPEAHCGPPKTVGQHSKAHCGPTLTSHKVGGSHCVLVGPHCAFAGSLRFFVGHTVLLDATLCFGRLATQKHTVGIQKHTVGHQKAHCGPP